MKEYPHSEVTPIHLSSHLSLELERRLLLVFLGKTHYSTDVHDRVIQDIQHADSAHLEVLDTLRECAVRARDALLKG